MPALIFLLNRKMPDLAVAVRNKKGTEQENLTENQKTFLKFLNRGEPPCDYEKQLLEQNEDRVNAILQGKIVPPKEIEIQPTSLCNLNCRHCFGKALTSRRLKNKIGEKEIKIIADRVDEFSENGFKAGETIKLCGTTGEPSLNTASLYAIKLFKDIGRKVVFFTNGLWLNKDYKEKMYLEYILEADSLRLSLDAGSEETFVGLKGRQGFNRIISNLEILMQKRAQQDSRLNVTVGYVVGRENYQEIVQATQLMQNLGIDEIRFRVDFTDPEGIHKLSEIIIEYIEKAKQLQTEDFKVRSVYSQQDIEEDSIFHAYDKLCFNQHFWACVGPDVELYGCGHRTYYGVQSYGSLLEHSFRELWLGEKRMKDLKNLPDKYCKFCSPSSTRRNDFMTFLYNIINTGSFEELEKTKKFFEYS